MSEKTTANKITNSICEAINLIIDKRFENVEFDRTVQAIIQQCVDEGLGKYKCKYQDSYFYAYSSDETKTYNAGTSVYVLIPGNDNTKDKTILGTVGRLGADYATPTPIEDDVEYIGNNCVAASQASALQSYTGNRLYTLYERGRTDNTIEFNDVALAQYVTNSSLFTFGATFRTSLDEAQISTLGNYGITIELAFKRENEVPGENNLTIKKYTLDSLDMIGNPMLFLEEIAQVKTFSIDGKNFSHVERVQAYVGNFNQETSKIVDDIFVKDFKLMCGTMISTESLQTCVIKLDTPNGIFFPKGCAEDYELIFNAIVRYKGKLIAADQLKFYWFVKDAAITRKDVEYNADGGLGWKCLNDKEVVSEATETTDPVVEWASASETFKLKPSDVKSSNQKYKCVVLYGKEKYAKEFEVKNLNKEEDYIKIVPTPNSTEYYYGMGTVDLKCIVKGLSDNVLSSYTFNWNVTDVNSQVTKFDNTTNTLHVEVKDIYLSNIYTCTVYTDANEILGSATITITNSDKGKDHGLVLENGNAVFKYDTNGISPTSSAKQSSQKITPLKYKVYDNNGLEIEQATVNANSTITWKVPNPKKDKTLFEKFSYTAGGTTIEVPNDGTSATDDFLTIEAKGELYYTIKDRFDSTKDNNTIELNVKYNNLDLNAKSSFTFTKEGDIGTNGTDLYCKIVPAPGYHCDEDFTSLTVIRSSDKYYLNYENDNGSGRLELNKSQAIRAFRVKTFLNGEEISVSPTDISWSILTGTRSNNSTYEITNDGSIKIRSNASFEAANLQTPPNDIIQCRVTYNGKNNYTFLPIVRIVQADTTFQPHIKQGGINKIIYDKSGTNPIYKSSDYEIEIPGQPNLIHSTVWQSLGNYYVNNTLIQENLFVPGREDKGKMCKEYTPSQTYSSISLNNGIHFVGNSNTTSGILDIFFPTHAYINAFNFNYLNEWSGNSVEIDSQGGRIVLPELVAGTKNANNKFTGVAIGKVEDPSNSRSEVGIMGFHEGVRSVFIDAQSGKSVFGKGEETITIDPNSSNKGLVINGKYNSSTGTGLEINFSNPHIKFGSGKFEVNSEGKLTASDVNISGVVSAREGTIGGWKINTSSLSYGKTSWSDSTNSGIWLSPSEGLYIGKGGADNWRNENCFWVGVNDGRTYATAIEISGDSSIAGYKVNGTKLESNNESIGMCSSPGEEEYAFWSGSNFKVNRDGVLTATGANITGNINASSGSIAGWTINSSALGTTTEEGWEVLLQSDGTLQVKNSASPVIAGGHGVNYAIQRDGHIIARYATFSNGTNSIHLNSQGLTVTKATMSSGTIQSATISNATITTGTIGSLKIDNSGLHGKKRPSTASSNYVSDFLVTAEGIRIPISFVDNSSTVTRSFYEVKITTDGFTFIGETADGAAAGESKTVSWNRIFRV